jgi:hypothetical protein
LQASRSRCDDDDILDAVLRPALMLVALSGCHAVFGLEHLDVDRAACGPYTKVTPVAIVGVSEPRQFSITADEQLALVIAIDEQMRTRPIPLQWNGEAWEPHVEYQVGLVGRGIEGARLSPPEATPVGGQYMGPVQPAMNVWLLNTGRHEVDRYYWTGTMWTQDTMQTPVFNAPEFDTRAGNVVVVPNASDLHRVRHTVITKVAVDQGFTNQIVLHANTLPSYSLVPKAPRTQKLNEESAVTDVVLGDAVLSDNQSTLVYAAVSGGQSDVYATAESPLREFGPGGLIAKITTADDEVEPWIDATCSKLYFRRIPAGSPNDPGQIFVAE